MLVFSIIVTISTGPPVFVTPLDVLLPPRAPLRPSRRGVSPVGVAWGYLISITVLVDLVLVIDNSWADGAGTLIIDFPF